MKNEEDEKENLSKKKKKKNIDIDQILLESRHLFLFEVINNKLSKDLIQKLIALDIINTKPIVLWINSGGGCLSDGFAIIDTIKSLRSSVITIINGMACSMAGLVSLAGDVRYITKNSRWMSHDLSGGVHGDYTTKVLDRTGFLKREQKRVFKYIKNHTKLTDQDLKKAKNGELWMFANECKKKGIVECITSEPKRRRV